MDETYAVFKIVFARIPHALGLHMGPDIFHFVVFFYDGKWCVNTFRLRLSSVFLQIQTNGQTKTKGHKQIKGQYKQWVK